MPSAPLSLPSGTEQLRERALVLDAAVRQHVVGVDGRSQRVVDDEGLAVAGQRDAVGLCDLIVEDGRPLGADRQIINVGGASRHDRAGAGIGDVNPALRVHEHVVGRQERLACDPLGDRRHSAVAAAFTDPLSFRRDQSPSRVSASPFAPLVCSRTRLIFPPGSR